MPSLQEASVEVYLVGEPRRQARYCLRDQSRGRRSQLCEVTALRVPRTIPGSPSPSSLITCESGVIAHSRTLAFLPSRHILL